LLRSSTVTAPGRRRQTAYRAEGREMGSKPPVRFVTASLHVEYMRPTPLDTSGSSGKIKEIRIVKCGQRHGIAGGETCARGEVVAVKMPEHMMAENQDNVIFAFLRFEFMEPALGLTET